MRKKLYDKLIEDYIFHLVIGEDIPENVPEEFHILKLYVRDKNDKLQLYADISLPYLINHSEFLNIEGDPRYYFKQGYDPQTGGCQYFCEVKPCGEKKGVYRILNGDSFKIISIDPLCEFPTDTKEDTSDIKKHVKSL